jgi:hypothetical protein
MHYALGFGSTTDEIKHTKKYGAWAKQELPTNARPRLPFIWILEAHKH